jgi:hypothetical protein
MGRAIELVTAFNTNPGAVITAMAACSGNSLTVRGTDTSKNVWLVGLWSYKPTAGTLRLRSPRLHDNVQGMRYQVGAALSLPLYPGPLNAASLQRMYEQDAMVMECSGGGAAEIECASMLLYYEDLAGVAGRFIDVPTLKANGLNYCTVEAVITAVATGQYGGAVTFAAATQNLIANTDYAIVGGVVDTRGCCVQIVGVDVGNLGTGFPAEPTVRDVTSEWFANLCAFTGLPCIPVINSANAPGLTIAVQTSNAGGTYTVDLTLVQLKPGVVPAAAGGGAAAG